MKRILTITLACLLVLSALAGCSGGQTEESTSASDTETATSPLTTTPDDTQPPAEEDSTQPEETQAPDTDESTQPEDSQQPVPDESASTQPEDTTNPSSGVIVDPTDQSDLPSDLNYNKEQVNFIYVDLTGKKDELVSDGTGSLVAEAVFTRNQLVETQLNITMNCIPNTGDDVTDKLQQDVLTGGGEYDIIVNGTYKSVSPALDGYYVNLSTVPYLNTTKDYWTQGFNDMVTFGGKQYLATGSAAISLYRYVFLTLYDQSKMNDRQLPDLYETVKNYEWTLDTQWSIIQGLYQDANDSGQKDDGDFYGFVTGNASSIDPYMVAADIHLVGKEQDTGKLYFDKDKLERVAGLQEKVSRLYNDASAYYYQGAGEDWAGITKNIINAFTGNRAVMVTCLFLDMETEISSLASMDYGIAPIPMYDQTQGRYYSYVQDQVSCFGISAVVTSEERLTMLGAVLDCLAWRSSQTIPDAYYNTTLSLQFMNDPRSPEILDLIFDSIQFDLSSTCSNMFGSLVIRDELRPLLCSSTSKIASATKKWESKLKKALGSCNEKIEKLP